MSEVKGSNKRRGKTSDGLNLEKENKRKKTSIHTFLGYYTGTHQIRDKAQKDGQKKTEETISSVGLEVKTNLDETKSIVEKERQAFVKALTKSAKECECSLKDEYAMFQAIYERFSEEKTTHLSTFQGKRKKVMLSDLEKSCADKIAAAEDSLKKKKQDGKCFNILRKSLGSFFDGASDEDFPHDD